MARRAVRRSSKRWLVTIATLLATFATALALAILLGPIVQRERAIEKLRSDETDARLRGMAYLIAHADDPALHRRLAKLLSNPGTEPATYTAVARAMRHADAWGPSIGPAWLHYLRHRVRVGGPNVREAVAIELIRAGMSGARLMREQAAVDLCATLAADASTAVRRTALRAAATLAFGDAAPIIRRAIEDADPAVAYRAYLFAGWNPSVTLEPPSREELAAMAPEVAMAAMWAVVHSRRGAESLAAVERWAETGDPGRVGLLDAFLPYLLHIASDRSGEGSHARAADLLAAMLERGDQGDGKGSKFAVLRRWRAILAMPIGQGPAAAERFTLLAEAYRVADREASDEVADLLAAAAASRLAGYFDEPIAARVLQPFEWSGREDRFWRELAVLENVPAGSLEIEVRPAMPAVMRAAAARAAKDPGEFGWLNAFDAEAAGVRHMAAFAARDRLADGALDELIEQLLRSSYRREALGGAVLAGLSGRRADLVRRRLKLTDDWLVSLHLKLALYMMNESVTLNPETLLVRRTFPGETVLLALMHRGERAGLDRFFEPLGAAEPGRMRRMLDQGRYWHTLKRYLPADAPPFWLWADRALQLFQADVMRAWHIASAGRRPTADRP